MHLDTMALQELLLAYGEYPAKYRLLVWDFLLRLPHNSEAFQVPTLHSFLSLLCVSSHAYSLMLRGYLGGPCADRQMFTLQQQLELV